MAKDPYRYFRIEARELLEQLGRGALDLERDAADPGAVPRLLRAAHTLKGAARVVKQADIADQAHAIEDTLAPWRDGAGPVPRESIDRLLARMDQIAAQIATLAPAADAVSPTSAPAAAPRPEISRTVRADVADIDLLADAVGGAYAQVAGLQRRCEALAQVGQLVARLRAQVAARASEPASHARHGASRARTLPLIDEVREAIAKLSKDLSLGLHRTDRELRQVREAAEQLRLVPAGTLFTALERSARDAAQTLGKRVQFVGRGGDVRLDAAVLGSVQDAVIQLVRNAVAHGIEGIGERLAAGKPIDGRVGVDVLRQGRKVLFRCSDDGSGVDVEAVHRQARLKGLVDPSLQSLDARELQRLLFGGGISTSAAVTQVSGRGVGLDVVRETAHRLGGEVALHTAAGRGTTLELTVPLSLASLDVLMVECGGLQGAIPLDAVRRTLRLASADIAASADSRSVVYEGQAIPFIALTQVLDETAARTDGNISAVVVEGAGALAAVGVDRLLSISSRVLRPLPELVPANPVVAGAAIDVEGNPQLVFDPEGLVQRARRGAPAALPPAARARVLVVDDSLTTRMLEQSILESAGYEVDTAVSAEHGLQQAGRQLYSLFLVDVEMPGMDGFGFIERVRADPVLRDIPAMLVTSRSSPEDRRRGEEAGAQGYIVKSEFAQAEFLDRVRQLVRARAS